MKRTYCFKRKIGSKLLYLWKILVKINNTIINVKKKLMSDKLQLENIQLGISEINGLK